MPASKCVVCHINRAKVVCKDCLLKEQWEGPARNVATGLGYVACAIVGERAGWAHHRCRDIDGEWARMDSARYAMERAGLWVRPPTTEQLQDMYDDGETGCTQGSYQRTSGQPLRR